MAPSYFLVVARYNEDVEWVKELGIPYIIYNKGKDLGKGYFSYKLENIGRDVHTYFYHIVNVYPNFSDVTFFVQGSPDGPGHGKNIVKIKNIIKNKEVPDFLSLGRFRALSDDRGFPFHRKDPIPVGQVYEFIFGEKSPGKFEFIRGGQFAVSREVLLSHSLEFYNKIYQITREEKYRASWTLERMLHLIFKKTEDKNENN